MMMHTEKKPLNFLVLGVGGNVSQGIITAIRHSKIPCRIVGACISAESLGLYMCDAAYISPYAYEESFIEWVIELSNTEHIDMIFSGVEEIIFALSIHKEKLQEQTKAIFVSSDIEKLEIGGDKYLTAQWLESHGFHFPLSATADNSDEVERLISQNGFPLLAKPRKGKGSAGIFILHSREDLKRIPNHDYCIQAYIGDESSEYTVACYVDKMAQQKELIILRRELKYGTTFMAEIIENEAIKEACIRICNQFKPIGPLNIQLRMHQGVPVCFELNVRFSGTAPIRANFGYNDVDAMIREYMYDEDISAILKPKEHGKVYRYFNEFYVDQTMQQELMEHKKVVDASLFNNIQERKA